ncbi:uncharacterized protein PRCAT00004397001 [Priceomyces carsonii]|uniref:uncharacterized protein n=1 Tax=Priceomyces carsonii TaxID=28549 RepID=UPI002ED95365|nr:unnamed protein product [Priceomyces carsonii]
MEDQGRFYQFEVADGHGKQYNLNTLRNKVVVIVNVASLCGFTPQYKELQELYEKYKDNGLVILGFPCNQFGNQEPLEVKNIVKFTKDKFGVTFPIMKKVRVNGENTEALYDYLKTQQPGPLGFKGIRWNFEKFIVNKDGKVVKRFESKTTPSQFEALLRELLFD